jgi:hypothetical protein
MRHREGGNEIAPSHSILPASSKGWFAPAAPRARPETITWPARPMARASWAARASPEAEALRAPITAIFVDSKVCREQQSGRCRVRAAQKHRILRLAKGDKASAKHKRCLNLALGLFDRHDADWTSGFAACDQFRQGGKRRPCASVTAEQALKRRSAGAAANQTSPRHRER